MAVVDGMCYSRVHGRTNFHHAENICKAWGGHLFSYKTEKQWKFMKDTMLNSQDFWVGLKLGSSPIGDPGLNPSLLPGCGYDIC